MPDPVIVWNEAELALVARQDYIRRAMAAYGGRVAGTIREGTPTDTGAGAASVHSETVLERGEWTAHAGWDTAHSYLRYPNWGTRYMPAQHFLEHAIDRYR